jgi:N utilization substance protein B
MAGKRHSGRVAALQALFEVEAVGHPAEETLKRLAEDEKMSADAVDFARELTEGVLSHRDEIDDVIGKTAPQWPLDQIAAIDRNILRLAIYEILIDNKVPMRAAINEAVELAKQFGGETSPRFINGVLGSVSLLSTR